jgi:hypothetical protein
MVPTPRTFQPPLGRSTPIPVASVQDMSELHGEYVDHSIDWQSAYDSEDDSMELVEMDVRGPAAELVEMDVQGPEAELMEVDVRGPEADFSERSREQAPPSMISDSSSPILTCCCCFLSKRNVPRYLRGHAPISYVVAEGMGNGEIFTLNAGIP